jgi:hypothetical protein
VDGRREIGPFCSVRREDDRVSRWIAENWRDPHADDPNLSFAMTVARARKWSRSHGTG